MSCCVSGATIIPVVASHKRVDISQWGGKEPLNPSTFYHFKGGSKFLAVSAFKMHSTPIKHV